MRLSVFFMFLLIAQTWATSIYSQETRMSLNMNNVKVLDVLNEIEKGSEFYFFFTEKLFDVNRNVNINVKNVKIDEILQSLFQQSDITYKVVDRQIILTKKTSENSSVLEDGKSLSGKVTDITGGGLPGVSVVVKGTTTGVITDMDGKYTLPKVPENAILQFSFVGMKTQEIAVGIKTFINTVLEEETVGIEEVVAVGYGVQKKRELTGAVGSVSQEDIAAIPITRFDQALQGRIAGVNITQSGQPGGDVNIRIRGIGTMNNNSPLIVIDGIPVFGDNGLKSLNPNDIKTIEILKDGASSAIYGARAANGVVLVTTKRGKEGKTKIDYSGTFSIQSVGKKIEVLNGEQYALLQNEARAAQGVDPLTPDWWNPANIEGAANTNWQSQILRSAPMQDHTLTLSGGSEKASYLISGNYVDQQGVIKKSEFERYSLRVNTDAKVLNIINIGSSLFFQKRFRT